MAKSVSEIKEFEEKLKAAAFPVYQNDIQRIAKKFNFDPKPWNLGYYVEKDKKEVCEFDLLEFKKYFEFNAVLSKFIGIIEKLFAVKLEQIEEVAWHETVITYRITKD